MPRFRPGEVFHSLLVEGFLAAGAHGEVFRVRSLATGEPLALKVVPLADRGSRVQVERALGAARGAYGLDHPNVCKVYDIGCEPDGTVYLVMELLRGCSLDALVQWGRVSAVFAVSAAIEAARGLAAAHAAAIVHRDVKPANLFLMNLGGRTAIKVLDFSTAKVFHGGVATTSGRAGLGTPGYGCPEQSYGGTPLPGWDVFSLGTTLWEMLAGFHPCRGVDPAELLRVQRDVMPPLLEEVAGLPSRVDHVIRRAVAKDPAVRYRTMVELGRALLELRTWLVAEDLAGRVWLRVPPGQPPIPGDTNPYDVPAPPATFDAPAPAATVDMDTSALFATLNGKEARR
jgi:serine/threonine-protein kinase